MRDLTAAPLPRPLPTRERGGAWHLRRAPFVALCLAVASDASGGDIFAKMKAGAGPCG